GRPDAEELALGIAQTWRGLRGREQAAGHRAPELADATAEYELRRADPGGAGVPGESDSRAQMPFGRPSVGAEPEGGVDRGIVVRCAGKARVLDPETVGEQEPFAGAPGVCKVDSGSGVLRIPDLRRERAGVRRRPTRLEIGQRIEGEAPEAVGRRVVL